MYLHLSDSLYEFYEQNRKIKIHTRLRRLRLTLTSRHNGIFPHYDQRGRVYICVDSLYENLYEPDKKVVFI